MGDDRPLRVLMVMGAYPTAERPHWGTFIHSQVESLLDAGVEVDVIHPPDGPLPLRYLRAVAAVLQRSRTRRYDVIHGHYGHWNLAARLQWTTPVVAAFLGSDLLGIPTASGTRTRKSRVVVKMSQWLARHVDAVIVKSREMADLVPGANVTVLPNGVDFKRFRPIPGQEARTRLGWHPDRRYVLFGNDPAIPRKAYPVAEAAVECLRSEGTDVQLVVASGLPNEEMVWYLNASDALILPSLWEGSPNIVKEAMACNVPVVATDVGDVREIIGSTAGCTICRRDPDDLARGLRVAFAHHGPTTGRADIAHLDRDLVVQRLLAVYDSVIKSKHVAGPPVRDQSKPCGE